MAKLSPVYLWLYGLASIFIKGASHVGMVILSGTGIAQMIDASGMIAHATAQPLTFKYFAISVLIGGALKAMAYLDEQPLPKLAPEHSP